MQSDANPMHNAHAATKCHAKAKATGRRCKAPAVVGWKVCRMHGAGGGAPTGPANGAWKHGGRSNEAIKVQRMIEGFARLAKATISSIP
ncbi:MAG: hypothetical protein ACEQSU_12670 [Microgenomates group bacterium]